MKRKFFILLLVLLTLAAPAALAEQTLLTTSVPSEHMLTVICGEGGSLIINGLTLSGSKSVTIDRQARVVIEIKPNQGFELDTVTVSSDYGISIQGSSITVAQMVQDITAHVSFVRTQDAYTVTFDPNGGTGSMAPVHGVSGAYTLPACGFTAPEGMRFKTWKIGTTEYPEGASIDITTDITATAMWEIIPPVVSDQDVLITNPTTAQLVEVYEGETASMTVTAENANAYQWYINYGDGTGWHTRGINQPSYTTSPVKPENNGYSYKCVVTGTNGSTAESPIFTLQVLRKIELPQTGDNSTPLLWGVLMLIGSIGLLILRKNHKQLTN